MIFGDLADSVDEALTIDLDLLDDVTLHDALVELDQQRARLAVAAARVRLRFEQRGAWAADGTLDAATAIARDTHTSISEARREVRRAHELEAMPLVRQAIVDGLLSLCHVDLLSRARHGDRAPLFERDEAMLVDQCASLRFRQAHRAVDYWCRLADDEAGTYVPPTVGSLQLSTSLDGVVDVTGSLEPVGGQIVANELRRLVDQLRRQGREGTPSELRAAALVEMALRSAGAKGRGRIALQVIVGEDTARRLCETWAGTVLHPDQLTPHIDDVVMESFFFDGTHTVLGVSHRRLFTDKLRSAVLVRDRHCQHASGCDVPIQHCDVDHVIPWSERPITTQHGGRAQCAGHNRHPERRDQPEPLPERAVHPFEMAWLRTRWRRRRIVEMDIWNP